MTEALITVFTKDNPDRLKRTLSQYSELDHPVVLLDDSVNSKATMRGQELCKQHGLQYHGRVQQERLLSKFSFLDLSSFISNLGTKGWTLGATRNYSLLLSAAIDAEKLIMVDDDIKINKNLDIKSTVAGLNLFDYVGAHIEGMPDHSVVGYLARSGGLCQDCYVSGSFLGVKLSEVSNYFINRYNEDWIWLLLENEGSKPPQLGSVHQLIYNPFKRALEKAHSQEFGEILLNGVFKAEQETIEEKLINEEFWKNILRDRMRELRNIGALEVPSYLQTTQELVIESLLDTVSKVDPNDIIQVFKSYFSGLARWRQILDAVSKTKINDDIHRFDGSNLSGSQTG